MLHLIDGFPLMRTGRRYGYVVTAASSAAGHRGAVEDSGFRLPGRRGKIPVFAPPGPQYYTLEVRCEADEYVLARDLVADLHRRLPDGRLVDLQRQDAGLDVYAPAQVLTATETTGHGMDYTALHVKFVFEIPGGVWLDSVENAATVPVGTNLIPALSDGSAPMEARFTITGNGATTSVKVTDVESGAWWRIAGNIPTGTPVTVDPLAHTATAGATDYAPLLTVGDRPFYVSPGAELTQVRNGSQLTQVMARRSWYE